ncbi:hypothetical protein GcM1_211002 [Golovinomyces cichoracearum]|uniref:Uncharacterized protein n=1 Tax=Golovinomyces cichoracearum TaxID=62708 RepID=A0A420IV15_9PEZI|nr:hypothetical protein GcM1_211002 [Golovinomyces cichoracearum]
MMRKTICRRWSSAFHMAQCYRASGAKINVTPSNKYATAANVTRPSFWLSLIPKSLRKPRPKRWQNTNKKEWNPATFFIISFLLIGSNSIQMIALKRDFTTFYRKTNVRINLLQDVIERIKNGEKVDVESILGTGNEKIEQEWEDVPVVEQIGRDSLNLNESPRQSSDCGQKKRHKCDGCSNESENPLPTLSKSIEGIKAPPGFF